MNHTKWHGKQMTDFGDRQTFFQYERKRSERIIEKVIMPVASWGICANKYCSQPGVPSLLGWNYCVNCYDRGAGRRGQGKISKTGTVVRKVKGGTNEGRTDTSITKR